MENLGIATPRVKLLPKLPNVNAYVTKTNFESSAYAWQSLQNSPFFTPLLMEYVADPDGGFAALHPSKRIYWINNFLADGDAIKSYDGTDPIISWKQINGTSITGSTSHIMKNIIPKYDQYVPIAPSSYPTTDLVSYKGPIWYDDSINQEPSPDDEVTIQEFLAWVGDATGAKEEEEDLEDTEDEDELIPDTNYIHQSKVNDGLWWGMESSAFLEENMPFWINVRRMSPPTSADHDTLFVISLGLSDSKNRYDILLSINNKARVIDWIGGEDKTGAPQIQKEFESEGARIWSTDEYQRIGIMTVAGRLVVLVNNEVLVYSRIDRSKGDNGGKLIECKIAPGAIQIFGTNSRCVVNVSPMTFAQYGAVAVPVPVKVGDVGKGQASTGWTGVNFDGKERGSVAELPTPPSEKKQLYGVDCKSFFSESGGDSPSGFGFHSLGNIYFEPANDSTFSALPSTEFYVLSFRPTPTSFGNIELTYGGCPYYFRLKGINIIEAKPETQETLGDITNLVISVNESVTAPDYFHCTKSCDITCYDEGGIISRSLADRQNGVEVQWGWGGESEKTFTGVITSFSTSQKAGMETVTIRAEDYMFILKNTPIINSPFYDGMVAYYAIKDMAQRASLEGFVNDWQSTNDYFLPAGFAFSKPAVRYPSSNKIFECMMDVVKRFEAFLYFNEDGKLVITKFDGGLFSEDPTVTASFQSDPSGEVNRVLLDEKRVEVSYASTVNVISAMTLERDTRNPVLYVKSAKGEENNLIYKRVALYRQPALGELEVCRNYVEDLSQRVFYPILKTQWKTADTTTDVFPLDFVTVDGQTFRVTSLKRSYNADQNDLTTSYEGEWLGGASI